MTASANRKRILKACYTKLNITLVRVLTTKAIGQMGLCQDPSDTERTELNDKHKEDTDMEIIKKTEGLTSADLYALTKGNDVRKMADAKGEVLDIIKYVLYKDNDVKGEPMTVLAVETSDGAKYATNSKTFVRNFTDIVAIFAEGNEPMPTRFLVGSGISKSNREYITCDIAP